MNTSKTRRRWTREELLLSLDLYKHLRAKNASLGAANPEVVELSRRLNRPVGSITLRLLNYLYCENYVEGKEDIPGLKNGGTECEKVWEQYGRDDEALKKALAKIPDNVGITPIMEEPVADSVDNSPAISLNGEQANKIVVMLSIAMHQDMGELYSVLMSMEGLSVDSPVAPRSISKLSEQVQNLPDVNIATFKDILNKVVGNIMKDHILNLMSVFDKRFRN